jgi:hypothetical protein
MQLSIVTVTWNSKSLITKLLESILHFTKNIKYEIIVVDNNSSDGTVDTIQKTFRSEINAGVIRVIANHDNRGFSKGNNQGLKISRGQYVLFMNPDMELVENSFGKIIDFLEKNEDVNACTCQLNYGDNSLQKTIKRFPTLLSQLLILLKLHHFLKKNKSIRKYLALDFDYTQEQPVEQAMGAFIFLRRSLIEKIKGWDEDYPLLWEDIELCKRIAQLGQKILYLPSTHVIHYESQSFAQVPSLNKQKRFNRGMLIYFKKHHTFIEYLILLLMQPLSYFLAFLTQILHIKQRPQSSIK